MVWFQNRRAKWRKQARLQLLQDAWRMRCLGLGTPPLPLGHSKPDSSPEAPESPNDKDSPEPPGAMENRDLKSPRQDPYMHNSYMEPLPTVTPNVHEMAPMPNNEDGRMMQQPFAFPPLLMTQQMDPEVVPTDLRVMSKPNPCACGTSVQDMDQPQNLAYRQRRDKEASDSDTDTEIDLTSHSKDDDIRESERLASRIATSMFRSDTVLHDMMPNDLSLGAKNGSDRVRNNVSI
ncbi:unnamed protein product [Chrysodeixis includens]|uniref:Homeobox domain-containing protein n=1 Tax=Chrysodeixis includens TaxID=689277 RepID=A0A9P0FSE8_CHRIL|nr:unnamed protein product [Chrysodeixis includens]